MSYSISDWTGHDRSQYFSGAYVKVKLKSGTVIGRIENFDRDGVSMSINDSFVRVDLDQIDWDGLTPPKCVALGSILYFIAPLGARTTRKPVTRGNLSMMSISRDGSMNFGAAERVSNLTELYLAEQAYPRSPADLRYVIANNNCAALSPSTGYQFVQIVRRAEETIYNEYDDVIAYEGDMYHDAKYTLYHRSVQVFSHTRRDGLIEHVTENWEKYSEE